MGVSRKGWNRTRNTRRRRTRRGKRTRETDQSAVGRHSVDALLVQVETDRAERIAWAEPFVRAFIGQALQALLVRAAPL